MDIKLQSMFRKFEKVLAHFSCFAFFNIAPQTTHVIRLTTRQICDCSHLNASGMTT